MEIVILPTPAEVGRLAARKIGQIISRKPTAVVGLATGSSPLAIYAELGAQVQAGIDKLPPDLRTCVILRDIEELSYQEIVDLLKIPEGTVKSRINRGRIELAKILRRMRVVAMSNV